MTDLANIQKWLTSIIIRPGKLKEKILAADKTYLLDHTRIIRSSHRSGEEQIHIYARGYVLRLMECMRADYPALLNLLGEELFTTFVQQYLVQLPPHSPSLFDLGEKFPDFIKASQPHGQPRTDVCLFDLPVEIAMVERAKTEVLRSRGLEGIESNAQLYSFFSLLDVPLKASPSLKLVELQFDVMDFIKLTERNLSGATPERRSNLLAIYRKDYFVKMQQLEDWQWWFLKALQNAQYRHSSIISTAQRCTVTEDMILANLMVWLPVAIDMGYVYVDV